MGSFSQSLVKQVKTDEINLYALGQFINPKMNILEIGGHCGTSSIVYSSYLNEGQKVHVYEPQLNMYNLLVKNIEQNNLQNKIIPYNSGVFCFSGKAHTWNCAPCVGKLIIN